MQSVQELDNLVADEGMCGREILFDGNSYIFSNLYAASSKTQWEKDCCVYSSPFSASLIW